MPNENSNRNKKISGISAQKALRRQLDLLKQQEYIKTFDSNCSFGHEGMSKNQFSCNHVITFNDDVKWILFSTTSMRTDRFRSKQWDAMNIKIIDPSVQKAYIICSGKSEKIKAFRNAHMAEDCLLFVDGILTQEEFFNLVEDKILGDTLNGRKSSKKGFSFQTLLKTIMSDEQNLQRWKGSKYVVGLFYKNFENIIEKLTKNDIISPNDIIKISASTNIKMLPAYIYADQTEKKGGHPKTDLVVTLTLCDESEKKYRISCKNASGNRIPVVEFPPKYCAAILGYDFNGQKGELQNSLEIFLEKGSVSNFAEKKNDLVRLLQPNLQALHKWALAGSEKHCDNPDQIAEYIVTRKAGCEQYSIETIDECINKLTTKGDGDFNTIFHWTVTSTKKTKKNPEGTKNIQLRISI